MVQLTVKPFSRRVGQEEKRSENRNGKRNNFKEDNWENVDKRKWENKYRLYTMAVFFEIEIKFLDS
jgi:hypothetical protein